MARWSGVIPQTSKVGLDVGAGLTVGSAEGAELGALDLVGEALRALVGAKVGALVGAGEGAVVGPLVGALVGPPVGAGVGGLVGLLTVGRIVTCDVLGVKEGRVEIDGRGEGLLEGTELIVGNKDGSCNMVGVWLWSGVGAELGMTEMVGSTLVVVVGASVMLKPLL
jgi:hypothetical protein